MDPKSKERLDQILQKSPRDLSDEEVAFLRARKMYLKQSQIDEYKEILVVKHQTPDEGTENKHGKKSR